MKILKHQYSPYFFLGIVGVLVFGRTLKGDFLSWDDNFNIYNNLYLLQQDYAAPWVSLYNGYYMPITATIWLFLAGTTRPIQPFWFHFVNVVFHIFNSFLIFHITKKLLKSIFTTSPARSFTFPALTSALVFCLHPLQVEPVAWASGLRDLLAAFFSLLTIHYYVGSTPNKGLPCALLFFGAALLCKPSATALPLVLWIIQVFIFHIPWKKASYHFFAFFMLALPIIIVTKMQETDAKFTHFVPTFYQRPLILLDTFGFYIGKLFWPFSLAANYSHTPEVVFKELTFVYTVPFLMLFCLGVWLLSRKISPSIILGPALSAALLMPVTGFVPFAYQAISTVADRYMYLPLFGFSLVLAIILTKYQRPLLNAFVIVVLVAFSISSFTRAGTWKNDLVFYSTWIKDNPKNDRGYIGLATVSFQEKNYQNASHYLEKAFALDPLNPVTVANLAIVRLQQGNPVEAFRITQDALSNKTFQKLNHTKLNSLAMVYYASSMARLQLGDKEKAYEELKKAHSLYPAHPEIASKLKRWEEGV